MRNLPMSRRGIIALLFSIALGDAFAIGLGDIEQRSSLHQPLDARISLIDTAGVDSEDIRVSLASHEDFQRAGVERPAALSALRFAIAGEDNGQLVVRVTSADPITEPYLRFLVEALWPQGRLLKVYTLLMNPRSP